MDTILVAPSYKALPKIGEEFISGGKTYIKVQTKTGSIKTVRTYSQKEYDKFYPPVTIINPPKSRRDVLGFGEAGFIWILKGNTYSLLDWLRASPFRYTRVWGWYLPSNIELPQPFPVGIEPLKLMWEEVSKNEQLMSESEIQKLVESKIYEPGTSEWVGELGERLSLQLVCRRAIEVESGYGISTLFSLLDENENVFVWVTSSRKLEVDHLYSLTGTVKDHTTYHNVHQTILSNCRIKEDLGSINE